MKRNNIVKWRQTGPGIWTPVPDDASSVSKKPVRKEPSVNAGSASASGKPAIWQMPSPAAGARIRT